MSTTPQKCPQRAFALQKYLLLHSQHDTIQKHLNQATASLPISATTSPSRSPDRWAHWSCSSSPTSAHMVFIPPSSATAGRQHRRGGSTPHRPRPILKSRRSSLPTVIDETNLEEIEEDELKLKDVNRQIKKTLTELLNCESVREDSRYRNWVQTRLMATERELKQSRSRACDGIMWESMNESI